MSLARSATSTRSETIARHLADVAAALLQVRPVELAAFADEIVACWARAGTVHVLGNGGSQANAAHLVLHLRDASVRAHDVMAEGAWLSAQANDHGYRTVGTEHLRVCGRPGDVLLVISGSGNSQNVIDALEFAGRSGIRRLGLLGFGGGQAAKLCDAAVVLTSNKYGPVEDAHSAAIHALSTVIGEATFPVDLRSRE